MRSQIITGSHSSIHSLSCIGGSSYGSLGSKTRSSLSEKSIRLTVSITLSSPSVRTAFEYLPMISIYRRSCSRSPISLTASKCRHMTRSFLGWVISVSLAPPSRLRSSIHSIGGTGGFSIEQEEICTRGESDSRMSTLRVPFTVRNEKTSSSRAGWYIWLMREPMSSPLISRLTIVIIIPSKAISSPPIYFNRPF